MRTLSLALSATLFVGFVGCAEGVPPDELFGPSPGEDAGAPGANDPLDPANPAEDPGTEGTGGSSGTGGSTATGGYGGSSFGGSGGSSFGGSGGSSFGGSGGSGATGGTGGTDGTGSVPSSWYCTTSYYGDGRCDCGCGVADPDCNGAGCSDASCSAAACEYCHDDWGLSITCDAGTGGTSSGGAGWTCDPTYYDEGSSIMCDCGCGIPDPDCGYGGCVSPECYESSCNYCFDAYGYEVLCSSGTGTAGCSDTCAYYDDGDCDDGGPGASYSLCDLGTDCSDCGPR